MDRRMMNRLAALAASTIVLEQHSPTCPGRIDRSFCPGLPAQPGLPPYRAHRVPGRSDSYLLVPTGLFVL